MDALENKVSVKFTANPWMENWIIYFPSGWAILPGFISITTARWLLSPKPITSPSLSSIPHWQAPIQQDWICFNLNTWIVPLTSTASQWTITFTVKHALLKSVLNQGHKQGIKDTKEGWIARQFTWKIPWCYPKKETFCLVCFGSFERRASSLWLFTSRIQKTS